MDDIDLVMALEAGHAITTDPGLAVTARKEADKARVRWESAKTRKARREAAEDLEWWGNRVAFLSAVKLLD